MSSASATSLNFTVAVCLIILSGFSIAGIVSAAPPATSPAEKALRQATPTAPSTPEKSPTGYLMATAPRQWIFPRDHGRHDGFKTEWWYFAGNVADPAGRPFGFQLTFFRVSISPLAVPPDSILSLGDYYFAHAAVSDLAGGASHGGAFHFQDIMSPAHAGVASSAADTLDVRLRDWSATLIPANAVSTTQIASRAAAHSTSQPANDVIALNATDAGFGIHLICPLTPESAPVLQGPGGVNLKGREHGEASYYYSIPRLPTSGTLVVRGQTFHVTGHTWMDHEFSSNAMGKNQVGWDWVGLTLADGKSLMVYRLRNKAGGSDFLSGTLIDADGHPKYLTDRDITFTPTAAPSELWKSASGGIYPQVWSLEVAGLPPLRVRSRMPGQELRTDATTKIDYFEGACQVTTAEGKPAGEGYLEMTGYAKPINPF